MRETIKTVEQAILAAQDNETADDEWILTYDDGDSCQIWREPWRIYIPALNIDVCCGETTLYNDSTGDFEVNTDLFIVYEHGTNEEVYNEWGTYLPAVVGNYAHARGMAGCDTMKDIEQLECVILWEKEDK